MRKVIGVLLCACILLSMPLGFELLISGKIDWTVVRQTWIVFLIIAFLVFLFWAIDLIFFSEG